MAGVERQGERFGRGDLGTYHLTTEQHMDSERVTFTRFFLAIQDDSVRIDELPVALHADCARGLHEEMEEEDMHSKVDPLEHRTVERSKVEMGRYAVQPCAP